MYEELVSYSTLSYECVRRQVVYPPGIEMIIDMNSQLSIPNPPANVECYIDGVHTVLPRNDRLMFDTNLPDTSDVHVRFVVEQPLIVFEYTFVPSSIVQKLSMQEAGYYDTKKLVTKLFRRSKTSLHEYMSSRSQITLGLRPFSIETIISYPNITKLQIDLYMHGNDVRRRFQLLLKSMPWLEELYVHIAFYSYHPFAFELFDNLPKKLTIHGYTIMMTSLERLESVRDLTIQVTGNSQDPDSYKSALTAHLTRLESLTCIYGTLQVDLKMLTSLKRLHLNQVSFTYRDCVAIGRLLRRNQLQSLVIENCTWFKKNELRPIVQPLLDGTNTSLRHLGLVNIHLSAHMVHMLSHVIAFCPTLTSMRACTKLNEFAQVRSKHFENMSNLRIAQTRIPDGCPLGRALDLTVNELTVFVPIYKRKNRRWGFSGHRELVFAPFELNRVVVSSNVCAV